MKSSFWSALLAGCFAVSSFLHVVLATPESRPGAPKPIAHSLEGAYQGEWKSNDGTGDSLRLVLTQEPGATWTAKATFYLEGAEVPCKVTAVKVEGTNIELVFAWDVQGTSGTSTLHGQSAGLIIEGKYETKAADAVSSGTWKVSRAGETAKG